MQRIRQGVQVRQNENNPRSGLVARYAVTALAGVVLAVTTAWGFEQAQGPAGLAGIFPETAPDDLRADSWSHLDGNWAQWSEETAAAVEAFYAEPGDVAAQRAHLDTLRSKLKTMTTALGDARYASLFDPLSSLSNRLRREIELAEAILHTLELDPQVARQEQQDRTRAALLASLDRLEQDLRTISGGTAWLAYVDAAEIRQQVAANDTAALNGTLSAVHARLAGRENLQDSAQKDFLERPAFLNLEARVADALRAATAADAPYDPTALRAELEKLVTNLSEYTYSSSNASAAAVREAFTALKTLSPDGGERISAAIRPHFVNYNMRALASEAFLNRFVADRRTETGPVRDYILGANVSGNQVTYTDVGLNLKPSNSTVRFDITLNGNVHSSTAGVTDQATIFTSGNHRFNAAKEINFDGDVFYTAPARISVAASNTTTGARTDYSKLPLLGGIADRIAVNEARERRGQSEAIAAGRVQSQVTPRFNSEVDAEFANASAEFHDRVIFRLRDMDLYPSARSFSSTEHELRASTRLMADGELAGSAPLTHVRPGNGVALQLHESLLNNSLDRMDVKGKTMSEEDFEMQLENHISAFLGREFHFEEDVQTPPPAEGDEEVDSSTFVFAENDPIRVKISDGILTLIIRTGLKRGEGEEDIPTQEISVPLTFTIDGDAIVIESGTVGVAPLARPESLAKQLAYSGVMRNKIQHALPTRRAERRISVNRDEAGHPPVEVTVTEVTPLGGWLIIKAE